MVIPTCVSLTDDTNTLPCGDDAQDEEAGLLNLIEVTRPTGLNDVGMVAWRLTLHTPEYPDGRPLVVIANDITVQVGYGCLRVFIFMQLNSSASFQRGRKWCCLLSGSCS